MKKFLIFVFVAALALGAIGFWLWQRNSYSKEVLKLEILGPSEAQLLDQVEYTVKYKNNGNITLEDIKMIFEYPEYSAAEDGKQLRQEMELEDIYPGEENSLVFKGRLLGRENDVKKAKATVAFRPKNIKAFYESKTSLLTRISFIPLTFEIDLPSRVESGRDFKFFLNYFSNLNYPISNLRAKIEYPSGFEFLESKQKGLEKNEWELPIVNKAEGGRIEVKGRMSGDIKEQKIFRANLGIWQGDDFILLKETTKGLEVAKPYLYVFQRVNDSDNYIASPGDMLHYEVFFRNVGEDPFANLFLVSKLSGKAFDFNSLKTNSGQLNKNDNSIMWDEKDLPQLRFLGQGEEGKVEFWINLKKDWDISGLQDKNFTSKNTVLISSVKEEFETKVNSKLAISQKAQYQDGEIFDNSGPIPPKVGEATTYTVTWQAKNYYNDVNNVKVKAILPPQVRLTGKIFPADSRLTFDSQSREIVWEAGNMEAGKGILNPAASIAFQVVLTPILEQKGQFAQIIGQARITGDDQFTEQKIEGIASLIMSDLPDDPSVNEETGKVQ